MMLKFSRKTYQTLQAREECVTYFLIKFRYSPCTKTKQTHGLMESFFFFLIKRTKNWWKWNYKLASFWSVARGFVLCQILFKTPGDLSISSLFQREAPSKPFLLSSSFRNNFYDKNSASSWTKEKISLKEVGSIH